MELITPLEAQVNRLAKAELGSACFRFIPFGHLLGLRWFKHMDQAIGRNYPYQFQAESDLANPPLNGKIPLIEASREEGIRSIAKGIAEDASENTWIYIPALEVWINDAYERTTDTTNFDPYFRKFLTHLFPQIELVHTHPDKMLEGLFKNEIRTQHYLIEGACPTSADLVSLTVQQSESNQSCRLIGRVISHYGYCDYELSNANIRIRSGGRCTNCNPDLIVPGNPPEVEIVRLLQDQERRATILGCLPDEVPSFHFKFVSYSKM